MFSKKKRSLQKHQIENIKFYRDQLKARQATVASAAFRNELLTRQDTINYKNEYNRLKMCWKLTHLCHLKQDSTLKHVKIICKHLQQKRSHKFRYHYKVIYQLL